MAHRKFHRLMLPELPWPCSELKQKKTWALFSWKLNLGETDDKLKLHKLLFQYQVSCAKKGRVPRLHAAWRLHLPFLEEMGFVSGSGDTMVNTTQRVVPSRRLHCGGEAETKHVDRARRKRGRKGCRGEQGGTMSSEGRKGISAVTVKLSPEG